MNRHRLSRRRLLQSSLLAAGSGILAACGSSTPPALKPEPAPAPSPKPVPQPQTGSQNSMRLFACSGFAEDPARIQTGLDRLTAAGFAVSNHMAAYRRFQRFAGSDAERIADLQDVASGRAPVPKVLMGVRGGYGAIRLLPHIDWASLGSRMREHQTLLFGFSDVSAVQLALLAKSGVLSFAGPMLYSEFGKMQPDNYTMDSFIRTTTRPQSIVAVPVFQSQTPRTTEGVLWGGNLSVLASLAGSPYMPDIPGGILFLEDVSEQPYRIERMLQTLYLSGVLKKQQALILGDFRMGSIRDTYDTNYNLTSVAQTISRVAGIPVLQGFPFGHVANKTTFPLGAHAKITPMGGGYQVAFDGYPTLNPAALNLSALLPPPPPPPVDPNAPAPAATQPASPAQNGGSGSEAES